MMFNASRMLVVGLVSLLVVQDAYGFLHWSKTKPEKIVTKMEVGEQKTVSICSSQAGRFFFNRPK